MTHEIVFEPNPAGVTVLRTIVDAPNLFRAVRSVFREWGPRIRIRNAYNSDREYALWLAVKMSTPQTSMPDWGTHGT